MVKLLEQCLDDDEYTRCGFRDFSITRDRDIHAFSPKPATRKFPKGVVIDVHGSRAPSDYGSVGPWKMGSARLISLLRSFNVNAEFLKVTAAWGKDKLNSSPAWLIHVLDTVACIDLAKSNVVMERKREFQDHVRKIKSLMLKPRAIRGHHLFRIAKCPPVICVSDQLADAITSKGLTGMVCLDLSDYGNSSARHKKLPNERPRPSPDEIERETVAIRSAVERTKSMDDVQREVRIRLPAWYRRFMENYPAALVENAIEFHNGTREAICDRQFLRDPKRIVQLNLEVRRAGVEWTDDGGWPQEYLAIGDDGGGGYWVIDTKSRRQVVRYYEHETGEFERRFASLQELADWEVAHVLAINSSR